MREGLDGPASLRSASTRSGQSGESQCPRDCPEPCCPPPAGPQLAGLALHRNRGPAVGRMARGELGRGGVACRACPEPGALAACAVTPQAAGLSARGWGGGALWGPFPVPGSQGSQSPGKALPACCPAGKLLSGAALGKGEGRGEGRGKCPAQRRPDWRCAWPDRPAGNSLVLIPNCSSGIRF